MNALKQKVDFDFDFHRQQQQQQQQQKKNIDVKSSVEEKFVIGFFESMSALESRYATVINTVYSLVSTMLKVMAQLKILYSEWLDQLLV